MSASIRSIIYGSASHSIPAPFASDGFIWNCVAAAHMLHRSYHCLARIDRYTRVENAPALLAGLAIDIIMGDKKFVQFLAKVLESSLHTLKAVNAYIRLINNIDRLKLLLKLDLGGLKSRDLNNLGENPVLSPSTVIYWKDLQLRLRYTMQHLISTIIEIIANFFLLSSHILAACEALQGHDLQVMEGPLNLQDIFKEAYKLNNAIFYEVNDEILKGIGASITSNSIYKFFNGQKNSAYDEYLEERFGPSQQTLAKREVKYHGKHLVSKVLRNVPWLSNSYVPLSPYGCQINGGKLYTIEIINKNIASYANEKDPN